LSGHENEWRGNPVLQCAVALTGLTFCQETPAVCALLQYIPSLGQKQLFNPKRQFVVYDKMYFLLAVCPDPYVNLQYIIIITVVKKHLLIQEPWEKLTRLLFAL